MGLGQKPTQLQHISSVSLESFLGAGLRWRGSDKQTILWKNDHVTEIKMICSADHEDHEKMSTAEIQIPLGAREVSFICLFKKHLLRPTKSQALF